MAGYKVNEKVPDVPEKENATVPEWILARRGINLIINNKSEEAKELFLKYPDSIVMFSGYSFALFMDALMSFEEDKMNEAISTLKEVEKRCAVDTGWFRHVIPRVFGTSEPPPSKSLAEQLETQIILADSQVCIGILTFLQQDISGYFKAGWVLRKAWKVYQKVYKDVSSLYTERVGELHLPDPSTIIPLSTSTLSIDQESTSQIWDVPTTTAATNGYIPSSKIPHSKSAILHKASNGADFTCLTTASAGSSSSQQAADARAPFLKKSTSTYTGLLSRSNHWSSKITNSFSLHNFPPPLNIFSSSQDTLKAQDIDPRVIERLMGAVSFGFGLFQLGVSLLPPSLLRLTNILGFAANKQNGIACLMYARQGADMRTPLATLGLLWYHTIVRPFFAVDGSNVQAGVEAATVLLKDSESEFEKSALFLFFGGRVSRLKSDIKSALKYYQQAAENTNQREMKLLSLHEAGWCHVIELNFSESERVFSYLYSSSRWSQCFYMYMAAISAGASPNSCNYKVYEDLSTCVHGIRKGQLEEFLNKRIKYCPTSSEVVKSKGSLYWKLLVFEMLYLWNALPSCSSSNIEKIINDCSSVEVLHKEEPMTGLSKLILGCACTISGQTEEGIKNLRKCLDARKCLAPNQEDAHISAYAQYELASLLIRKEETRREGKMLLQEMSRYSKYDFEHKLSVRVYSLLKSVS